MGRCLAWHLIVDGVKTESARGGLKRKCLFLGRFRRDSSYGKYPGADLVDGLTAYEVIINFSIFKHANYN